MSPGTSSALTACSCSNYLFPTTERTLGAGSPPSLANAPIRLPPAAVLDSRQQSLPTAHLMGTVHHPRLASNGPMFIVNNCLHAAWHGEDTILSPKERGSLTNGIHKLIKPPNYCRRFRWITLPRARKTWRPKVHTAPVKVTR